MQVDNLTEALARRAARHPGIRTVIDIGASDSQWSRVAEKYFPDARYLVEANPVHEPKLKEYISARPGRASYEIVAAGAGVGETWFYFSSDPYAGGAINEKWDDNCRKIPTSTIDLQVARHRLAPPYLLKFDTHGFEVEILAGAAETLKATDLIQMEVYNFAKVRFPEMRQRLETLGFQCVDMSDPMWRPGDGTLWQMDLYFARKSHELFARNMYF